MKRLILFLLGLSLASPGFAGVRSIVVIGNAKGFYPPDYVSISIDIEAKCYKDQQASMEARTAAVKRVYELFEGFLPPELQGTKDSLTPENQRKRREYLQSEPGRVTFNESGDYVQRDVYKCVRTYEARHSLSLKLDAVDREGDLIGGYGAIQKDYPSPGNPAVTDEVGYVKITLNKSAPGLWQKTIDEKKLELIPDAALDAKANVDALAKSVGVDPKALSLPDIQPIGTPVVTPTYRSAKSLEVAGYSTAGSEPIEHGELSVTQSFTFTYYYKDNSLED